jgi:hypothetical protein
MLKISIHKLENVAIVQLLEMKKGLFSKKLDGVFMASNSFEIRHSETEEIDVGGIFLSIHESALGNPEENDWAYLDFDSNGQRDEWIADLLAALQEFQSKVPLQTTDSNTAKVHIIEF